jgi:hypothetical protein
VGGSVKSILYLIYLHQFLRSSKIITISILLFELLIQIPFEDNTGEFPKWSFTQSLNLEFESDYSTELMGKETNNASSEIGPDLFCFNFEPKEQPVQQNLSMEHTPAQSQDALKSECGIHGEHSANYSLNMKHAFMEAEESLKKVDSFSRWISKELAAVDDLHMQSSPGVSWGTDECGNVIDDTSLNPSLSQDQLFSIHDFSPKWAYAGSEIEVLIMCNKLHAKDMHIHIYRKLDISYITNSLFPSYPIKEQNHKIINGCLKII